MRNTAQESLFDHETPSTLLTWLELHGAIRQRLSNCETGMLKPARLFLGTSHRQTCTQAQKCEAFKKKKKSEALSAIAKITINNRNVHLRATD